MMQTEEISAERLAYRAKNLLWTVSGNHSMRIEIDGEAYDGSSERCLYEAAKFGGAEKFFGLDEIMLYTIKKSYMGANTEMIKELVSLCMDGAVYPRLASERLGVAEMRRAAYDEIIEEEFARLTSSPLGQLELAFMQVSTQKGRMIAERLRPHVERITRLGDLPPDTGERGRTCGDIEELRRKPAYEIIRAADEIYNTFVDTQFGKKGISLDDVLSVTVGQMAEDDYFREIDKDAYISEMLQRAANTEPRDADGKEMSEDEEDRDLSAALREVSGSEATLDRYTEIVFGRSALSRSEAERLNRAACAGIHLGRKLHVTTGLLDDDIEQKHPGGLGTDIHHLLAQRHRRINELTYYNHHRVIKQNARKLAATLKRCLLRRSEPEMTSSHYGALVPSRLWRIGPDGLDGRRHHPPRIFERVQRGDDSSFAVDVLVDGSGSQARRQSSVAAQAYIIATALSMAGVAHRVMSYCTMQDRTVLQRFRDFDDPISGDWNIFRYTARAANRDGLAIRGAAHGLVERHEQNKIMIILSDGKPNDITVDTARASRRGRGSAHVAEMLAIPYVDETAVDDTAREVRRVRDTGIPVLGVFAGAEDDLDAERRIFGKDFAYIRSIVTFSQVVGKYLERCMDS